MTSHTRRPSIVMILTDDYAAHSISGYGSVVNRTSRIDEIAASGWLFESCLVTNSFVFAEPGVDLDRHAQSHQRRVDVMDPDRRQQTTFITQLGDAGYQTAIIGKLAPGSR